MNREDEAGPAPRPRVVQVLVVLVAITSVASLLYAAQYWARGPLRLPVVSPISDLALSPKKNLLAAAAEDGALRFWEVPRRLTTSVAKRFDLAREPPWVLHTLPATGSPLLSVAFSRDGKLLTSLSADGRVQVWDTASFEKTSEWMAQGAPLVSGDLSSDGSAAAALSRDGTVRVWGVAEGTALATFGPSAEPRRVVAVSPDGSWVAAGSGPNVEAWDLEKGASLRLDGYWEKPETEEDWQGHRKQVTALAFSRDNKTLASGAEDATLAFWDLATGRTLAMSEGHWAGVSALLFDTQGASALSGSQDNKARVFRLPGGKSTAIYEGHLSTVASVAFGPVKDTILTAGADGTIRMWETANQYVTHLEWSRKGFQPTWGRTLAVWALASGLLGLLCWFGLSRAKTWSYLLTLALYLLGPIIVLGLPLLEGISYPLRWGTRFALAWPLLILLAWYVAILVVGSRQVVGVYYEAPHAAPLAQKLMVSQRTTRLRFGIYTAAVWIALLVLLYSLLRRFNLDIAFMGHYLSFIMAGSLLTLVVSAVSIALAVVLALFGALGRLSRNPIANGLSSFYISLIRGTPLLVQIYIWYLGLPRLDIVLAAVPAGVLALGVNYGAYMTEIFRAGIQAIGKGQHEAAAALGMSRAQTLWRIVLPQAFRIVIPPIGNEFIAMMKDSSLVSVMAVWELTYRAQKIGRQNFRNMETFLIAAAFYWILTVVFQFLQGSLEEHMGRSERR